MEQTEFFTGDPFTDVGGAVFQRVLKMHPDWTKKDALHFAAKTYLNLWSGKLHAFFLNSGITNPANKGKEMERTLEYYESLLKEESAPEKGWCRVSGKYEPLYAAGRENQILSGSGTFINFNHGFEKGLQLGQTALLNIFFTPLGCIEVGGNPALVHSSQPQITALLAAKNLTENLRPARAEIKPGLAKSNTSNAPNTLFSFADEILREVQEESVRLEHSQLPALTLYNFTNFGAKPDVVLFQLSAEVFGFYQQVTTDDEFEKPWAAFVRAHYRNSKFRGARTQPDSEALFLLGKPNEPPLKIEKATYRAWYNDVYQGLIQNRSILPLMGKWVARNHFPLSLVFYYCQKILQMDRKTLDLIAHIAKHIAKEDDSFVKKALQRFSLAKSAGEIRQFIVNLQRRNYENEAEAPFISLEDYVTYLFPDGAGWRQTRDLLLIALYEQLHEANRKIELDPELKADIDNSEPDESETDSD